MENVELLSKLIEAEKYFTKKEYRSIVSLARELYERNQFDLCGTELDKLPSKEHLLKSLVAKLEGKSVYRTLKKIQEGVAENSLTTAKGLSSMLTHVLIECEQGNIEYRMLIPSILEKLSEVVYGIL